MEWNGMEWDEMGWDGMRELSRLCNQPQLSTQINSLPQNPPRPILLHPILRHPILRRPILRHPILLHPMLHQVSGIDIFRIFDSLNYIDNLKFGIDSVVKAGGVAEATLCYTGDVADSNRSKYNLDYYLSLAEQLVAHGVHSLAVKDMAGLLKPRAATLLVSNPPHPPPHGQT